MRKLLFILLAITMLTAMSGCNSKPTDNGSVPQTTSAQSRQEQQLSDNILFSINYGAPGFGTEAQCADAEIIFYSDRSVKVFMVDTDFSTIIETGSVELSDEDFEKVSALADRNRIFGLEVTDGEADDGSSYYITLYGENDEPLTVKGGYMPVSEDFCEIYNGVKNILEPYDVGKIVEAHRELLGKE